MTNDPNDVPDDGDIFLAAMTGTLSDVDPEIADAMLIAFEGLAEDFR